MDDQRDYAEERENAWLMATSDGELNIERATALNGMPAVRINGTGLRDVTVSVQYGTGYVDIDIAGQWGSVRQEDLIGALKWLGVEI